MGNPEKTIKTIKTMKLLNPLANRNGLADSPNAAATPNGPRRWIFLVRVIVVVVAVVLGYKLLRATFFGLAAYNEGMGLLELRQDGDLNAADLVQAQEATTEIYQSVAALEREMRFFAPVLRATGVLPGVGPTLAATPNLLLAGRELAAIANDTLRLTLPALQAHPDAPVPDLLLAALVATPDQFAHLGERAATAQAALAAIPAARLAGPLVEPMGQAQTALGLLADGLRLAPALPKLLGMYGAQSYLLLVQNNQELRPTGGFISAVGKVTVENGRFSQIDFTDSYDIARNDVDHPRAPEPQQRYMDIHLVFLRDANWSPDFPTTAQLTRSLYAQDAGAAVDGIVTVDLRAVQLMVEALGPLEVEGADEPVTGDNLLAQLQQFWDRPVATDATLESDMEEWWRRRKDFMPVLAQAALARLKSGSVNPLALAQAARAALDERAVQIWLADAAAAETLGALGWDGALRPQPGADYLALVDANMGYNKVDAVMERAMDYTVSWPDGPDAPALATLAVTYRHTLEAPGKPCVHEAEYGGGYADMIQRCYFDYVRLYAPLGSELVGIEGVEPDSVSSQLGERGTQVFAGYLTVASGSTHTVTFTYRLPPALTPENYRLVVQRQAGVEPIPLNVAVGDAQLTTVPQAAWLAWAPGETQP
jgi:hypothetical protein